MIRQKGLRSRVEAHRSVISFDQDLASLDKVLSAVPSLVLIVDADREVVYANRAMLDFLGVSTADILGKTPGEVLGCLHALEDGASCGSSPYCDYCGAHRALRESWQGSAVDQECHLSRVTELDPPALNLRVWSTPVVLNDACYVLMAATDISDEKRRQALERIFFHDILNTATIIDGAVKLLLSLEPGEDTDRIRTLLDQVTERLIDEIVAQRDFVELENRQLAPQATTVDLLAFLEGLVDSYRSHNAAKGREIRLDPATPPIALTIDKALLGRVLGNLLKNAIEAAAEGETVSLGCRQEGEDAVACWVHNAHVMPDEVRLQVFKRAFSTKGRGRGLGTYSARLLTERYLEGEIDFTSVPGEGTTFRVRYPLHPSYADDADEAGDAS